MLRLIRSYLEAGVLRDGVKIGREDGTPQGGPLSPLLANIMLDDLDRFLEKRGHRFCRYADDCNVYVQSERAAERVMKAMVRFIGSELRLRVNLTKSAVERPWKRKFLGYSFHGGSKVRIASESIERLKRNVRELTTRRRSIDLPTRLHLLSRYLRGWMTYFRLSETPSVLRDLDRWIRRRVRLCIWKAWNRPATRMRKLRSFALTDEQARMVAGTRRGLWFVAGMPLLAKALSESWLTEQGLISLQGRWRTLNPVC